MHGLGKAAVFTVISVTTEGEKKTGKWERALRGYN
jgi:hypothetical protein